VEWVREVDNPEGEAGGDCQGVAEVSVDYRGDKAEAGGHPPPVYGGDVCGGGSEACISLTSSNAFCARNGAVKETKLELEFSRYETYEDKTREVYRSKGLLTYTTAAKEYVRLI
jgi:predicted NBD/HSP70 family sugar kinase